MSSHDLMLLAAVIICRPGTTNYAN